MKNEEVVNKKVGNGEGRIEKGKKRVYSGRNREYRAGKGIEYKEKKKNEKEYRVEKRKEKEWVFRAKKVKNKKTKEERGKTDIIGEKC